MPKNSGKSARQRYVHDFDNMPKGSLLGDKQSALEFGLIDEIIPEPRGGAHRDPLEAAAIVKAAILASLNALDDLDGEDIKKQRYEKFRKMGQFDCV